MLPERFHQERAAALRVGGAPVRRRRLAPEPEIVTVHLWTARARPIEQRQQRRHDVLEADDTIVPSRRDPRRDNDQRNPEAGAVQAGAVLVEEALLAEVLAVVGGEYDDRAIEPADLIEAGNENSDLRIDVGDLGVVQLGAIGERPRRDAVAVVHDVGHVRPGAGGVGHQLAARGCGRSNPFRRRRVGEVRVDVVDPEEERLVVGDVAGEPQCARGHGGGGSGRHPRRAQESVEAAIEVLVLAGRAVGADAHGSIAVMLQELGQVGHIRHRLADLARAVAVRPPTREKGRERRRRPRERGHGLGEPGAAGCPAGRCSG